MPDPAADVVWAATGGGIFRSTDAGDSWESRSMGLECLDVTDLAVSPNLPTRLIASTGACGVYLSDDEGETWQRVASSLMRSGGRAQTDFWRVAVDPADPDHLFAATVADPGHLLEFVPAPGATDPLASSWVDYPEAFAIERFAFAADRRLFFATRTGRVYLRSPDASAFVPVWQHPETAPLVDLVLPGEDGSTVAVAAGGGGLWVFTDGGNGWKSLSHPSPDGTGVEIHFAHHPREPNAFPFVEVLAADLLDPSRLWYFVEGTPPALYQFDLSTLDVAAVPVPLPEDEMAVQSLLVGAADEWLGEGAAGVFRSREGGFVHASVGLNAYFAADLVFDRDRGAVAVAGGGSSSLGNGGAYRWSADGGWVRFVGGGLPAGPTGLVRFRANELWVSVTGDGVYRTDDLGSLWEDRNGNLSITATRSFSGLAFDSATPDVAVAGMAAGVYVTRDSGASWSLDRAIPQTVAWQVVGDVSASLVFFAAGSRGFDGLVFRSADGGLTWQEPAPTAFAGRQILSLVADPSAGGHLWVGTAGAGGFESLDGGASWVSLAATGSGFPPSGHVAKLAASGGVEPRLACSVNGTPYVARDSTRSWEPVTVGLALPGGALPSVQALAFDPSGTRLVAAIGGRGLWYLDLVPDTTPPVVAATPSGGAYPAAPVVELRADEPATVFYTTDGSAPSTQSPSGLSPVSVSVASGGELRYFAVDLAGNGSLIQTQSYRIDSTPPQVHATPPGGEYGAPVTVVLSANEAAAIHFTTEGTQPDLLSPIYAAPLLLSATTTLRFLAVDEAGNRSPVMEESYGLPASPIPAGGGGGGGCFVRTLGGPLR